MNKLILVVGVLVVLGAALGWHFLEDQAVQEIQDTGMATESQQKVEPQRFSGKVPEKKPLKAEAAIERPTSLPTVKKKYESWEGLDDSNSKLIRVIDRDTKEPVADATVAIFVQSKSMDEDVRREMLAGIIGFTEKHGKLYLTNPAGEVRVPKGRTPARPALLSASKGEKVATKQTFGQEKDTIVLGIAPRSKIKIKVTNMVGDPLSSIDTAIGLRRKFQGRQSFPLFFATTDNDGLSTINLVPGVIEQFPIDEFELIATAIGAIHPQPIKSIARSNLPSETIHLQIGSFGSLDVEILSSDGSPYSSLVYVSASLVEDEKKNLFSKRSKNGRLRIPLVSCGLSLNLTATALPKTGLKPITRLIQSPIEPGSKSTVTLQFGSAWPKLTGLALTSSGEPIREEKIRIQVFADKGKGTRGDSHFTTTTNTGHFEIPLSRGFDAKVFKREIEISTIAKGSLPPSTTRLSMSPDALLADIDLGTLTLKGPKILATGHVRDVSGNPIVGASFDIWNGRGQAANATTKKIGRPASDEFGAFTIYGETTASKLLISAHAAKHFQERVNIMAGATNVDIVLSRVCKIKGRLILPEGIDGNFFWVVAYQDQTHKVEKDGHFELGYLKPGPHKFAVLRRGKSRPYIFEKNVILEGGETRDLGDIPIQVSGAKLSITVKSPIFKARYNGLRIDMFAPNSRKHLSWFSIDEQKDTVLMPADVCDIHASKLGFRTAIYEDVSEGELTIDLKKGIPIRIEIENKEEIPKGSFVNFRAEDTKPAWYYIPSENADEKGRIFIMAPGEHKIQAFLKTEIAQRMGTAITITPKIIEVLDSTQEQVFKVRILQKQEK